MMKIGLTYLYVIFKCGYPHSVRDTLTVLPEIQKLGFHYLEIEGLGPSHLLSLNKDRRAVRDALDNCGLHVHNFCVIDPDLVSGDTARRKKAIDRFKIGAELGDFLQAETLHLASYAPPVRYLGAKPYQLGKSKKYGFPGQAQIQVPRGFKWQPVWKALVDSTRECADIAAKKGKTVLMEARVCEVICSPDSLLRLIEHVDRPNFKANFDTGHFSAQRENVVLALEKLRGQFANIHVADNNPIDTEHLPLGDGLIDWKEFFRVLKGMNYDGYLGLDMGTNGLVNGYRKSVARIRSIAADLKFTVEV